MLFFWFPIYFSISTFVFICHLMSLQNIKQNKPLFHLSLNWRCIWHSNYPKYIKHYSWFHVAYLKSTWLENRNEHIGATDLGQWEVIWLVCVASWLSLVLKDTRRKVLVTNHTCKVGSSLLSWNTGSEKGETLAKEFFSEVKLPCGLSEHFAPPTEAVSPPPCFHSFMQFILIGM